MSDDDREYHISPPPMGGNNPPPDDLHASTLEEIAAYLEFHCSELAKLCENRRAALLADARAYPSIEDEETQGNVAENRRMAETAVRTANERRTAIKAPFLAAERAIDSWFHTIIDPLVAPLAVSKRLMDGYVQLQVRRERAAAAERARLAEAEADRLRQEAIRQMGEDSAPELLGDALDKAAEAAKEAERATIESVATKPADQSRVRGAYGSVSSARRIWRWRVVKESDIPRRFLSPDAEKIKGYLAAGGKGPDGRYKNSIKGVEVYEDITSGVR